MLPVMMRKITALEKIPARSASMCTFARSRTPPLVCSLLSGVLGPAFPLGGPAGCLCNHHPPGASDPHFWPGQPHRLDRHDREATWQLCQKRLCRTVDSRMGREPGETMLWENPRWERQWSGGLSHPAGPLRMHGGRAKQRQELFLPLKISRSHLYRGP